MGLMLRLAPEPGAEARDEPLVPGNDVMGLRPGSHDVLRFTLAVGNGRLAWVECSPTTARPCPTTSARWS